MNSELHKWKHLLNVKTIMPILMVAHNTINSLNFSDSDLSEEIQQPLDFTMSKFKSSSPTKHPLYHQFYGSNSDTSTNHEENDDRGKWRTKIIYNTFALELILMPTKRFGHRRLRDF